MSIEVGTARANPKEKGTGFLKVGELRDSSPVNVPVIIVNGVKPGPRLWVQSNIHGTEYVGTFSILDLVKKLDPNTLNGALIVVPALNVCAVQAQKRDAYLDNLNMNRVWPGKPDGDFTQQSVSVIEHAMKAAGVTHIVDLHGGGNEDLVVYSSVYSAVGKSATESEKLAKSTGTEIILKRKAPFPEGRLYAYMSANVGVPSIIIEAGGGSQVKDEQVEMVNNYIINVMQYLRMLEGEPKRPRTHTIITIPLTIPRAKHGGLFQSKVKLGSTVLKGELIATVSDLFGNVIEEVYSPVDGMVIGIRSYPTCYTGCTLFEIGVVERTDSRNSQ